MAMPRADRRATLYIAVTGCYHNAKKIQSTKDVSAIAARGNRG